MLVMSASADMPVYYETQRSQVAYYDREETEMNTCENLKHSILQTAAPGRSYEEISTFWSTRSDNYSNCVREELATNRPEAWRKQILAQVPKEGPLRVLDAGCGPGFFTILLHQAGHAVTGVDGSEGMLAHARENARALSLEPEFLQMDCRRLRFAENTFDLILCRNVTHIFENHAQVYGEWKRVLKPGGVLLIFDANWHLPYVEGPVRAEAIYREAECFRQYGSNFSGDDCPYEYIGSSLQPANYRALGDLRRPDFDMGVLLGLGYREVRIDRDVTGELWSEKEKLMYGATPLFMVRAVK